LEAEGEVGDKADLVHDTLVRELHARRRRIACGTRLLRETSDMSTLQESSPLEKTALVDKLSALTLATPK
jgi:hypothetical protein